MDTRSLTSTSCADPCADEEEKKECLTRKKSGWPWKRQNKARHKYTHDTDTGDKHISIITIRSTREMEALLQGDRTKPDKEFSLERKKNIISRDEKK